jgi:hypothetical protein
MCLLLLSFKKKKIELDCVWQDRKWKKYLPSSFRLSPFKNIFFSHFNFRLSNSLLELSQKPSPSSLSLPPSIPYSHRPTGRPWSRLFLYLAVDLSLSFTQRVSGFDRCFRSRKDSKPPRGSIWLIFVCVFSVGISFDLWLICVIG